LEYNNITAGIAFPYALFGLMQPTLVNGTGPGKSWKKGFLSPGKPWNLVFASSGKSWIKAF